MKGPRRPAQRRGSPMPGKATALGHLLAGTRRPLRRVLELLSRDAHRVTRAFRGLLRTLEPSRDAYTRLFPPDLLPCYSFLLAEGPISVRGDEAFCLAVERAALTLVSSGVPENHAIAVVGLHLEACLPSLPGVAGARAAARLTSATQWLVAAAYCEGRVEGLRRLDDQERQKLSGDLHDEVGADLVVLKLYVEMIASELARGRRTPLGPKLEEALALIAHAIESVRRLTLDLGPAFLDTLGFIPVLRNFVRQYSRRTGIKVTLVEPDSTVSMPPGHEAALYRVLLGALSNVAKHARARRAKVTLRSASNTFVMVVEDDGKGFDVRAQRPGHTFGLNAMRERIRGLHGHLKVSSKRKDQRGSGSGTRLEIRLPLRNGAAS